MLELRNVSKIVGAERHIADVNLTLRRGSLNVLLGPTLSGKTSLMRLMAGLDRPTSGSVWFDDEEVTQVPPQQRRVAMVHQQFINYPTMTVFENIASPLRIAGVARDEILRRVHEAATLLKLEPYLDRLPLSLSGGQQQRTALARAIVKNADLVLLDEPLANLDYKLREELRAEIPRLFSAGGAIFVYATTEPSEALLLGGNVATLSEGRVTQFGPTLDVFRHPSDLLTARIFSDPPLNTVMLHKRGDALFFGDLVRLALPRPLARAPDGPYLAGFHAHHLYLQPPSPGAVPIRATVRLAEITGSESYLHLEAGENRWVMLTPGIHRFDPGTGADVYLDGRHILIFDGDGRAFAGQRLAA